VSRAAVAGWENGEFRSRGSGTGAEANTFFFSPGGGPAGIVGGPGRGLSPPFHRGGGGKRLNWSS